MRRRHVVAFALCLVLAAGVVAAETIPNWTAPPTWAPTKGMTASAMGDLSIPVPFIPVTPCRVADTRTGSGFSGQYGPPILSPGNRNFTITGQCGIPSGAVAVSFNFTIINTTANGDIRTLPAGGTIPDVSTMNWTAATQIIANAAVVPLGTGGAITVRLDGTAQVNLIIDVNGYYAGTINPGEYLGIYGNYPGGPVIYGSNSTTSYGYGVWGNVPSGTDGSAGVFGAYPGSARGYGVKGISSGTAANVTAVLGQMTGPEAAVGLSGSWVSSGVRGEGYYVGVWGFSNSYGVWGRAQTTGGAEAGYGILGSNGGTTTYGVFGGAGVSGTTNWAVYANGNLGATGTKPFVEPHPYRADTVIRYVALEGPEAGTYFRGKGRFVGRTAVIEVPESFRLVTDPEGLTIQVTPIGGFASVYVESIGLDQIELKSSRDVEFFYTVNGVRHTFKDWQVMVQSGEFIPESATSKIPEGLSAEQKRYLIQNGTYNADGTVNVETARRLGWDKQWEQHLPARAEN